RLRRRPHSSSRSRRRRDGHPRRARAPGGHTGQRGGHPRSPGSLAPEVTAMDGSARAFFAEPPRQLPDPGSGQRRGHPRSPGRAPLALILGPGERWDLISIALAVAFSLHLAMLVVAIVAGLLHDLHLVVEDGRSRLHDFFWRQYDVEIEKPKEEVKPEPPPP